MSPDGTGVLNVVCKRWLARRLIQKLAKGENLPVNWISSSDPRIQDVNTACKSYQQSILHQNQEHYLVSFIRVNKGQEWNMMDQTRRCPPKRVGSIPRDCRHAKCEEGVP